MTSQDEKELAWWRVFQLKFGPGNGPKVGWPIYGERLVLFESIHGEPDLVKYEGR